MSSSLKLLPGCARRPRLDEIHQIDVDPLGEAPLEVVLDQTSGRLRQVAGDHSVVEARNE
jgi:hypothetical protein